MKLIGSKFMKEMAVVGICAVGLRFRFFVCRPIHGNGVQYLL